MTQFQLIVNQSINRLTKPHIRCHIKIKTQNRRLEYDGIFFSTIEAYIAAQNFVGLCNSSITVVAIR